MHLIVALILVVLIVIVYCVFFLKTGPNNEPKESEVTKESGAADLQVSESVNTTGVENDTDTAQSAFDDILDITTEGNRKRFLLVRQFNEYDRLVVRITTTDEVITDIRITADTPYVFSGFRGLAFEFPTVNDYYMFAKRADEKLGEYMQPFVADLSNVNDIDLANAFLKYFDKPNMPVYGIFQQWERETRYIHQSGVTIGVFDRVCWIREGEFKPTDDTYVMVKVEYGVDVLLGFTISINKPNPENNPLSRIEERFILCEAHAAHALQHGFSINPHYVYDRLVEKFAPFGEDNISALQKCMEDLNIDYKHYVDQHPVDPKKMYHTIRVYTDENVPESNGYVPRGQTREFRIAISHVEQIVLKVEYEDITVTSGYWHDNPNYPFTDIKSKNIVIKDSSEIVKLGRSLSIHELQPNNLMEKLKEKFTTQSDFIKYLDTKGVKYHVVMTG